MADPCVKCGREIVEPGGGLWYGSRVCVACTDALLRKSIDRRQKQREEDARKWYNATGGQFYPDIPTGFWARFLALFGRSAYRG